MVAVLGAMLVLAVAGALIAARLDVGSPVVTGVAGGSAGGVGALWLLLRWRRGWTWQDLGLVPSRRGAAHLLWQVPASVAAGLVGAAALGSALGLAPDDGGSGQQDLDAALASGPLTLLLVGLCVVLVVPFVEEVVFRRVLLDWLLRRTGPAPAVVLTAALFAAVHVAPVVMAYVVFLGLFAGWLRLWHDSLWAALALHAGNNALVVLVAVQAS